MIFLYFYETTKSNDFHLFQSNEHILLARILGQTDFPCIINIMAA